MVLLNDELILPIYGEKTARVAYSHLDSVFLSRIATITAPLSVS